MDRKFKQILPADPGWYAKYLIDGKLEFSKVICWVLMVEDPEGINAGNVMPIVAGDGNFPMEADYHGGYRGVEFIHGETRSEFTRDC